MIQKIVLKVGDIELSLDENQARELYNDLSKLYSYTTYIPGTYPTSPTYPYPAWSSTAFTSEPITYTS